MHIEVYRENLAELDQALQAVYDRYVTSLFCYNNTYFVHTKMSIDSMDDLELLINAIAAHIMVATSKVEFKLILYNNDEEPRQLLVTVR